MKNWVGLLDKTVPGDGFESIVSWEFPDRIALERALKVLEQFDDDEFRISFSIWSRAVKAYNGSHFPFHGHVRFRTNGNAIIFKLTAQ